MGSDGRARSWTGAGSRRSPGSCESSMAGIDGAFIGRTRERAELAAHVASTAGGRGRAVAIVGEAGIGKSTLVERALADARAAGLRVMYGRCTPELGAPDFWPWQRLLGRAGF